MLSRNGIIVIGVLFVAIIIGLVTKPSGYKPQPIRLGPKAMGMTGGVKVDTPAVAAPQPAAQAPAPTPAPSPTPAPAPAAAAPTPAPAPPPPPPTAAAAAGVGGAPDFQLLQDRFGRTDPFEPLHPPAPKVAELPQTQLPAGIGLPPMPIDNSLQFRLTAIGVKDGRGIAVINGELYHAGDTIRNYTIQQITSDTVRLRSDVGEVLPLRIRQVETGAYNVRPGSISNIDVMPGPIGGGLPTPVPAEKMKVFDSGL